MQKIEISTILKDFKNTFEDIKFLQIIKTGKEAELYLVESENKLMVLKCYKPNIKYSTRHDYLNISEIGDKRIARAIKGKSKVGRSALEFLWAKKEYDVLRKLNDYEANVPKVYGFSTNSVLMEYLGGANKPALRLSETKLSKFQSEEYLEIIADNILLMFNLGFVHGDLSEFNILDYRQKPYIIDFPQVVKIGSNPNWKEILNKDLLNLEKFFGKLGCRNIGLIEQLRLRI